MPRRYQYQAVAEPVLMLGTGIPTRQFNGGGAGVGIGIGVTTWFEVAECAFNTNTSTEANSQIKARSPGAYTQLYCKVISNTVSASSTLTFRKNSAPGNLSITIPSTSSGTFTDEVHSDLIRGDGTESINYQLVTGGSGTTLTLGLVGVTFVASNASIGGQTAKRHGVSGGGGFSESTASDTRFFDYGAFTSSAIAGTESNMQSKSRVNGVVRNMHVSVTSNARGTASTIISRKNTANGNLVVSIGSGATGAFEDTIHQDQIVVGDLINFQLTSGTGTGALIVWHITTDITTADSTWMFLSAPAVSTAFGPGVTRAFSIGGDNESATEANVQALADQYLKFSNLYINVSTNTLTLFTTLTLRKNAKSNTNMSVSFAGGTTGFIEDTVNTDIAAPGDLLNYQLVTGGTGTTITTFSIGMKVTGQVELDWLPPLSEPVRVKPPLPVGAEPSFFIDPRPFVPTMTSWFVPLEQPLFRQKQPIQIDYEWVIRTITVEVVTVDKWYTQFSEPVRTKLFILANVPGIEFAQPPLVSFSWYAALSEPVRVKAPVPVGGEPFLFPDPNEFPLLSKWYQALSEPVRVKPPLREYPSFVIGQPPIVSFSWYEALSEPVRTKSPLSVGAYPFLVIDPQEFVLMSKWFAPLSEPVRLKAPLPIAAYPFQFIDPKVLTLKEATTVDRWFAALSEPVRVLQAMRAALQQSFTYDIRIPPQPEVVTMDKWFRLLSEPVRVKAPLPIADYPFLFIDPKVLTLKEATTVDRWFTALSEPVRAKAPLPIGAYPFLSLGLEFIFPDKWFAPLSEPVRLKAPLPTGAIPSFSFVQIPSEVVFLDKWFAALSEPVRFKQSIPSALIPSFTIDPKFVFTVPAIPLDSWFLGLSQPVLIPPPRYGALISSGSTLVIPVVPILKTIHPRIFILPGVLRRILIDLGRRVFRVVNPSRVIIVESPARVLEVPVVKRSWEAIGGGMIQITKDPNSIEDFTFDWGQNIGTDTIVASVWIVPLDLTQVSASFNTKTASVRLSGGTVPLVDIVTNRVTLASGVVRDFSMQITIQNQ